MTSRSAASRALPSAASRASARARSDCSLCCAARWVSAASAASASAMDRQGTTVRRDETPACRRKDATSRQDTANPNSASFPSETDPKLLTPSTRPQSSTSGPPLFPAARGAVWRMVSKLWLDRPDDTLPLVFTVPSGSTISLRPRPWARSTVPG